MSVSEALHDWEQLAASTLELSALRKKVGDLQAVHDSARIDFEKELEELEEEEREAILSIMAIYEQYSQGDVPCADASGASSAGNTASKWLVNKVGNEGVDGVTWGDVLEAWKNRYPDAPANAPYSALYQHKDLFSKSGLGKQAVLRLTTEGQAVFRESK
jgi:hypothetical protein